ncbi:hypothetical protein GCM10010840_08750 [Deinococcus aerolatus]|uniref:Response regulatory domain-containing protein n=1 Tax=Deinococcus aerolatus TaxID=522487 RepID=A0ABQ2G391_9DEIO|nr:hypothetical protein GCM10010840_08750 [Deinococcus aerolatus]
MSSGMGASCGWRVRRAPARPSFAPSRRRGAHESGARKTVVRHGGRLWLERTPGAGPTWGDQAVQIDRGPVPPEDPGVMRVLLVEDHVVDALLLSEWLEGLA